MNKQYRVFISSTSDLKQERQAAIDAVLAVRCIPECMEYFTAASDRDTKTIREKLAPCDFVVLLAGHKYGGSPGTAGRSYVELEYRLAKESGIDRLVFVKDDRDAEVDEAQRKFRAALNSNHTTKIWREPDEIAKLVMEGLFEWIRCRESVDVFDRNAVLVAALREYLKKRDKKPEQGTAHVVQYTAVNALELVRELLLSGIQTDLYVISPDSDHVVSDHQRDRLEDNIAQLRNRLALKGMLIDKLLRVYGYDAPGSLRAVMIDRGSPKADSDHDFVAIAPYVYQMSDPRGELILDIRGGEMPGLILGPKHSGFKVIAEMVASTLSNWHQHGIVQLIQLPRGKNEVESGS